MPSQLVSSSGIGNHDFMVVGQFLPRGLMLFSHHYTSMLSDALIIAWL